ncbi:hypothetical protein ACUHMQ_06800 [Chitinimonas sp. PSY-7]|uniref:hypothetical protein n=1 Tax=Chitinimonas sp. PSY-7 TaxID=3459088 RepID=UPI00403FDBB1
MSNQAESTVSKLDLRQFCCTRRDNLKTPFYDEAHCYASNGHIAIQHNDPVQPGARPYQEAGNMRQRLLNYLGDSGYSLAEAIKPLPEAKPCSACDGIGKAQKCNDCEGEGSFWHGAHEYSCQECDGMGQAVSLLSEGEHTCNICNGSGNQTEYHIPVKVGHQQIALHYLRIIAALPDAKLHLKPGGAETAASQDQAPILFTYTGGRGVVMPLRT